MIFKPGVYRNTPGFLLLCDNRLIGLFFIIIVYFTDNFKISYIWAII
jgi:hypothetical protein